VAAAHAPRSAAGDARVALRFTGGAVLLAVSAAVLAAGTHNPFIYFRF